MLRRRWPRKTTGKLEKGRWRVTMVDAKEKSRGDSEASPYQKHITRVVQNNLDHEIFLVWVSILPPTAPLIRGMGRALCICKRAYLLPEFLKSRR